MGNNKHDLTKMSQEELQERLDIVMDELEDVDLPIQKYHGLLHEKDLIEKQIRRIHAEV